MSRAHHVAVAVKGLYTSEKLLIIAEGDENLGMIADRLLEDREGPLVDFMFLELADLGLIELRLWLVLVLAVGICQCLFSQTEMDPRASWWSGVEWPEPNISENSVGTGAVAGLASGDAAWMPCIIFINISELPLPATVFCRSICVCPGTVNLGPFLFN